MKTIHRAELKATKTTPINWLIEGFFEQGKFGDIFGPPDEGKSTVALTMAGCVSAGVPFFGLKTKQTPVGWVTGEASDFDALARDLDRLKLPEESDITFVIPDREMFVWMDSYFKKVSNEESVRIPGHWELTSEGESILGDLRHKGVTMLFLDTTGAVCAGMKEIDNDQQRQLARFIREITVGMTVITISHTNQSSTGEDLKWRLHYRSRAGGNGFPGAIRWAAGLSKLQSEDSKSIGIGVSEISTRRLVAFGVSKSNEMPRPHWDNQTPLILEILPDGNVVKYSSLDQKKSEYMKGSQSSFKDSPKTFEITLGKGKVHHAPTEW